MRITWRLIVPLVLSIASAVLAFSAWRVAQERTRMETELDRRAWLRTDELSDVLLAARDDPSPDVLQALLDGTRQRERLSGLALFGADGALIAASAGVTAAGIEERVRESIASRTSVDADHESNMGTFRVHVQPLVEADAATGAVVVFQDAGYVDEFIAAEWQKSFLRMFVYCVLICVVTLLVLRWSLLRPLQRLAKWVQDLRMGKTTEPAPVDLLRPLTEEIGELAKSFVAAKHAAREEARLRHTAESVWTPERLREHCLAKLGGRALVVVSNREPYMHVQEGKDVRCVVPASGLVTALEPILRACGGTWVAHGSGSADRAVVDEHDRVRVPPEDPHYTLRRVWLSAEEEAGYYYGFANEGLWPLCHIAHTRPAFRPEDWAMYSQVNERFCAAVLQEIEGAEEPCVLIQDYHFALLASHIKAARPDARVAIFWHIPWPNPEAIGICPWQREIVQGLLAADLVGFHTQFHCNNFLETVDRTLESRIDWERFAVVRQAHTTHVKPFPISVAFTGSGEDEPPPIAVSRAVVARALGFRPELLAVGVDRIDYTKGIPERFHAVERFLIRYPQYVGRFTFVQIGAPSRTNIERYQSIGAEVASEAERINRRFAQKGWKPIVLLARHHSHAEIEPYYRAADVCLVTSLHDGMNLVAKEYVAARADELGALVLSQFAGASREMRDALIVNPYDVDQVADGLRYALELDDDERRARMRRLRAGLRERNVYRWAADLIGDLAQIRLERGKKRTPAAS